MTQEVYIDPPYVFNGVRLSDETILATRKWFADNAQQCIDEMLDGKVMVNHPSRYVAWREQSIREALSGDWDHTFTFLQRAYFIQTGESVPLLRMEN